MSLFRVRQSLSLFVAAIIVGACASSEAPDTPSRAGYTVVDLTPAIGDSLLPSHLNAAGQLLLSPASAGHTTFYLSTAGQRVPLQSCNRALDLNDAGQVLCSTSTGYGIWQSATLTPLPIPNTHTQPETLNDSGLVVGISQDFSKCTLAANYDCVFTMSATGSNFALRSVLRCSGNPIHIAAISHDLLATCIALYPDNLPEYVAAGADSAVIVNTLIYGSVGEIGAMNDLGDVVGTAEEHDYISHAMYWGHNRVAEIGLGTATSINNHGSVVGMMAGSPYIWNSQTSVLTSLVVNSGWTITQVIQINDAGQILATATHSGTGGSTSYVLLNPEAAGQN